MVARADAVQREPRKSAVMAAGHAGAAGYAGAHGDADGGRDNAGVIGADMVGRSDAVQREGHAAAYGEARTGQVRSLTGSVLGASSSALYDLVA